LGSVVAGGGYALQAYLIWKYVDTIAVLVGMPAATLTLPFDVLKTRLNQDFYQAQAGGNSRAASRTQKNHTHSVPRAAYFHVARTVHLLNSIYNMKGFELGFEVPAANIIGVVQLEDHFFVYGNGKRLLKT